MRQPLRGNGIYIEAAQRTAAAAPSGIGTFSFSMQSCLLIGLAVKPSRVLIRFAMQIEVLLGTLFFSTVQVLPVSFHRLFVKPMPDK